MSEPVRLTLEEQRRRITGTSVPTRLDVVESSVKTRNDRERRAAETAAMFGELVHSSASVADDLLQLRGNDAWSTSFAYLLNYSLAWLGASQQQRDERTVTAMLANMRHMCEELKKQFPNGRISISGWQRALEKFGTQAEPACSDEPHPFVDTLARQVLTIRNTGMALSGFRQFYAPSGPQLHIIRPA
jgi:hypothetical protein